MSNYLIHFCNLKKLFANSHPLLLFVVRNDYEGFYKAPSYFQEFPIGKVIKKSVYLIHIGK